MRQILILGDEDYYRRLGPWPADDTMTETTEAKAALRTAHAAIYLGKRGFRVLKNRCGRNDHKNFAEFAADFAEFSEVGHKDDLCDAVSLAALAAKRGQRDWSHTNHELNPFISSKTAGKSVFGMDYAGFEARIMKQMMDEGHVVKPSISEVYGGPVKIKADAIDDVRKRTSTFELR
jgi:hypothetical protein